MVNRGQVQIYFYRYDGKDILLEYDESGTVTARYIHGPGIDEPLAMEKNSRTHYYHADGLGSMIALTDSSGAVVQTYQYVAFGNIKSGAPAIAQPYTYTAREYDPETGLYFYRARYYDPKAGRFLQRDPIGFASGDANLYAYVRNNSVNWIDPYGLYELAPGAKGPLTPGLDSSLKCFEACVGDEVTVTSGVRKGNKGPHGSGNACDLGRRANPDLDRKTAEGCFASCFSRRQSYGQEEANNPDIGGTHYHFQNQPGRGGAYGFPPGIKPYQP